VSQSDFPTIKIDLNLIQTHAGLKTEDLIQKHIFDDLEDRVGKRLKWAGSRPKAEQQIPAGAGWVSFIDGTRGAGKSTFLHNAMSLLSKKYNDLAVMNWIDPSRIEANEILLLAFLQALNEKVKSKLAPLVTCEETRSEHDRWRKAFQKVAGGLVLFQKDHHPLNELDEDLFLDLGLEQAGHSANLRKNLNHLFEVACEILQVKALLFAFDDADTSSQHAINLIETIRKYLDTPRVMIVITGDLELYSLLVRQNFRHELAQGKRDEWGTDGSAGGRAGQQTRMLDHLEEQYLLKLFPLRERHHLLPIWRLADKSGARKAAAKFEVAEGATTTELIEFTRGRIEQGFRLATESDVSLYTEYLLMQPIRSVLQVLSRIKESTEEAGNTHIFSTAMLDLALQNLYHYNIAAEELAAEDFRTLTEAVFEVAMDDGDPDTSAYLRPTSAQAHNRGAMFGLSAAVAQQLHGKPGTCIAYLLRGPGMVKLAHDAANSNKRKVSEAVLRKEFNRYMGVGRKDDALGWARLATVALVSEHAISHNERVVRYGVVGLNQDSTEGYKGYSKIFQSITDKNRPYPAAAFSLVKSSGTGPRTFASIYNVLGLMGRLLQLTEIPSWNIQSDEGKKRAIKVQLAGFYPNTNSVSVPPWIAVTHTDNDEPDSIDESKDDGVVEGETGVDAFIDSWLKNILEWLVASQELTRHIQPSSVFMGKVWPRLFFGLENISDALRPLHKSNNFPTLMELFALCVVNAFLAEESTYHLVDTNAEESARSTLANPRSSARDYLKRLNKINGELKIERLPLTFIVATCPLITGLIKEEELATTAVQPQAEWPFALNNFTPNNFIKTVDWNELTEIAIQGKKTQKDVTKVAPKTRGKGTKQPAVSTQEDADNSATGQ
jgi:hypothetical protein